MTDAEKSSQTGIIFALIAFIIWIMFPLYWSELKHVDPMEILCHRIIWTTPVCLILMVYYKSLGQIKVALSSPKIFFLFVISTFTISVNWGLYIWSVSNDMILQASMGYFLNPLANVLAGLFIFKEQLRKWQWVSIGLAVMGVVWAAFASDIDPWVGLILACSFGAYGAVRKLVPVEAVAGLCVETLILMPIAVGYLTYLHTQGDLALFNIDWKTDAFLLGAGFVTAMPLVSYVAASKRLPISFLGILFYLVPTGLFFMATLLYGEEIRTTDYVTFSFIWAGLILFTWERQYTARRNRQALI